MRRNVFPDIYAQYPNVYPNVTSGSIYSNQQTIYPRDIPYTINHSRAEGNFVAQKPRMGKTQYCAYSCGRPSQVDLIQSVGGNVARKY
jgi:hypothetical protein